jgi:hypothetical protein
VSRAAREERRKRRQKVGVIVGAVALTGAVVGSIIAGQAGEPSPAAATTDAPATTTVQAATPPSSAPTSAPVPSPPPSAMTLTCPAGAGAAPRFAHEITAPAPYEITIDYGDGERYTNDDAHLGAIFSHTYERRGTYQVSAVLTQPSGATSSAACTYTWAP